MAAPPSQFSNARILLTVAAVALALLVIGRTTNQGDDADPEAIQAILEASVEGGAAAAEGQFIVLEFWATWCGPCLEVIPHMNALVEAFHDAPVRFISFTSEPAEVVREFLDEHEMKTTVAIDTGGRAFSSLGLGQIPHALVLDPARKVVFSGHPLQLTEDRLATMMGTDEQEAD